MCFIFQPKRKVEQSAWLKLEKFNGEKFPECVKNLLVKCAYDTLSSLRHINPDILLKIESFLSAKKDFSADLNCCHHDHYKSLDAFEFLPGHKDLILGIPLQIEQMDDSKKKARGKKSLSDDELRDNLVMHLMNYVARINLEVDEGVISEVNIHDFRRGSDDDDFLCKCRFICPFCTKSFTLTFKNYWGTSNLTQHFKQHTAETEECEMI